MIAGESLCGCCGGIAVRAPAASFARAGLGAVEVRSGDYWSYLDSMSARLTAAEYGALADLKTRDATVDASMALIDAWAVACDILSLYNQILTAETLLPTAQEIYSLHQLAALVGYRPHPGVSASAELAFTLSTAEGAPRAITLPSGVKVQSTPGPDEQPVIFETGAAIPARPAWNAMRPRLGEPQPLATDTTELVLAGTRTGLKAGDALHFAADDATPVFAVIRRVTLQPANPAVDPDAADLTRLTIEPISTAPLTPAPAPPPGPPVPAFPPALAAHLGETVTAGELTELLEDEGVDEPTLFDPLEGASEIPKRILVFRQSAGIFGNNAPKLSALPPTMTGDVPVYGTDGDGNLIIEDLVPGPYKGLADAQWADGTLEVLDTAENWVFFDKVLKDVVAGSHVALVDGSAWGIYQPEEISEVSLSEFAISGKSLRLKMPNDDGFGTLTTRGTTAYAASEWLDLPSRPLTAPLRAGDTGFALNGWAPGLSPGQRLVLTGRFADGLDAPAVEMATIAEVVHALEPGGRTTLTLAQGLSQDFDRHALRINGNVAAATHGESRHEVLGSGGAGRSFPTYVARQGPLTHVTAPVPGGAEAELELRVGGILWQPVADLLDAAPSDRVYTITLDPDGIATYGFGDQMTGALPLAGRDNITLDYRTGLGLGGRVAAGQLDVLMTRPLGLEGVSNPLPGEGGADPEPLDALRANVPLSCRTLDRVVSLSDFQDYARAYAGIAKARAERVKLPGLPTPGVVVTVAGEAAAEVPAGSDLYENLRKALSGDGIPFTRFRLMSFRPRLFRLGARFLPDPDRIAEDVVAAAEAALRAAFGFEARAFAQPVFASEVVSTLQEVAGVEAVILDRLYLGATPERSDVLIAEPAGPTEGAELVTLHPGPLDYLQVMS